MGARRLFLSFALLALALPVAGAQVVRQPGRTLAAEGDSVMHSKDRDELVFHWELWHLSDGSYEAVDRSAYNKSLVETYRFDREFMPLGYTLQYDSPGKSTGAQDLKYSISCQYEPRKLRCAESDGGRNSEATIAAEPPFVCVGKFYGYDFLWLMTGVVRLAAQENPKGGNVNTYDWTEAKPDELGLEKEERPMTISLAGEETRDPKGAKVALKLYQWDNGDDEEPRILSVDHHGMVVSLAQKSKLEAPMITMENYKEYEPWAPRP